MHSVLFTVARFPSHFSRECEEKSKETKRFLPNRLLRKCKIDSFFAHPSIRQQIQVSFDHSFFDTHSGFCFGFELLFWFAKNFGFWILWPSDTYVSSMYLWSFFRKKSELGLWRRHETVEFQSFQSLDDTEFSLETTSYRCTIVGRFMKVKSSNRILGFTVCYNSCTIIFFSFVVLTKSSCVLVLVFAGQVVCYLFWWYGFHVCAFFILFLTFVISGL
jgi:hypothetical protein